MMEIRLYNVSDNNYFEFVILTILECSDVFPMVVVWKKKEPNRYRHAHEI